MEKLQGKHGWNAEIVTHIGYVFLTLRDRRSRIVRRRRYKDREHASDELWRYDNGWRVVT